MLLGQTRILDGQNQILKTMQEFKERGMEENSTIMDGLDRIQKEIQNLNLAEDEVQKSLPDPY